MTAALTKANVVSMLEDYTKVKNANLMSHNITGQSLLNTVLSDLLTIIAAYSTDNSYSIVSSEPRVTIVPYGLGTHNYKVESGQAISYIIATIGGETSVPITFSATNLPGWLTLNSSTGVLTGTAPAISSKSFNSNTGASITNVTDIPEGAALINAVNAFGNATNAPYPFIFQVTNPGAPAVTSGSTINTDDGSIISYTITATNTPTNFVAYDLSQLGGTVSLNPTTGVISGTVSSTLTLGSYIIYVAGINDDGEGVDQAVTINVGVQPIISSATTATVATDAAISYNVTATNSPTSYAVTGLTALTGATFNTTTGALAGTVTATPGNYTLGMTATNAYGTSVSVNLVVTVTA